MPLFSRAVSSHIFNDSSSFVYSIAGYYFLFGYNHFFAHFISHNYGLSTDLIHTVKI